MNRPLCQNYIILYQNYIHLVRSFTEIVQEGHDGEPVLDDVTPLQTLLNVHKSWNIFLPSVADLTNVVTVLKMYTVRPHLMEPSYYDISLIGAMFHIKG